MQLRRFLSSATTQSAAWSPTADIHSRATWTQVVINLLHGQLHNDLMQNCVLAFQVQVPRTEGLR